MRVTLVFAVLAIFLVACGGEEETVGDQSQAIATPNQALARTQHVVRNVATPIASVDHTVQIYSIPVPNKAINGFDPNAPHPPGCLTCGLEPIDSNVALPVGSVEEEVDQIGTAAPVGRDEHPSPPGCLTCPKVPDPGVRLQPAR